MRQERAGRFADGACVAAPAPCPARDRVQRLGTPIGELLITLAHVEHGYDAVTRTLRARMEAIADTAPDGQ
jgi:hypothetical protein